MICISCGQDTASKAIYAGMPVKMCFDESCSTLWGVFSWVMLVIPFNGWFYRYEGNYPVALYRWLTYKECDHDLE